MKIAFDENVPPTLVRVFQTIANERQLRRKTGSFEFKSAADYAPKKADPDYLKGNDVPWLKRFAADGGRIIISGDTNMKNIPHERLALIEAGFVVIFFESQWSNWDYFRKVALLLAWWERVAVRIKRAKPGSFYHIPCSWGGDSKLRKVPNEDPRLLKIERRKKTARKKKPQRAQPKANDSGLPLWDHATKKSGGSG